MEDADIRRGAGVAIGQRIRALREERGWSRRDYAAEIERQCGESISESVIQKVEDGGITDPKLSTIGKYAAGFGLSTSALLSVESPQEATVTGSSLSSQPSPTIFSRYERLKGRLNEDQLRSVLVHEAETFAQLSSHIPTLQDLKEQTVRITVRYILGLLNGPDRGSQNTD